MTLFRPLATLAFCLLSTSTTFADASLADMAGDTACRLDRVREIIAGAVESSADAAEADRLIVENTADWLPDYNAFAASPEAAALAVAVAAAPEELPAATCRQFLPFAAVSASAARISAAGGDVSAGTILETCEGGTNLCLPAATSRIIDQCGEGLLELPLRSTC